MIPADDQIRSVVHNIWSTQLGLEVQDTDTVAGASKVPIMTAAVHVSGSFRGGVHLECSRALIRRVTAKMFSLPEDQLTEDDDRDVLGELTNVVAGNIKALIPGSNTLSLPTIIEGTDYTISSVDVKSSDDCGFALDGEAFVVTVLEHRG